MPHSWDSDHVPAQSRVVCTHVGACLWALTQAWSETLGSHRGWHICAKEPPTLSHLPQVTISMIPAPPSTTHTLTHPQCWVVCLQIWSFMQTTAFFSRCTHILRALILWPLSSACPLLDSFCLYASVSRPECTLQPSLWNLFNLLSEPQFSHLSLLTFTTKVLPRCSELEWMAS